MRIKARCLVFLAGCLLALTLQASGADYALIERLPQDSSSLLQTQPKETKGLPDKDKSTPPKGDDKTIPPKQPLPKLPDTPPRPLPQPQTIDPLAQAPSREEQSSGRGFNPHMLGDYRGFFARRLAVLTGTQTFTSTVTTNQTVTRIVSIINANGVRVDVPVRVVVPVQTLVTGQTPVALAVPVISPVVSLAAFKIAENESPLPEDRFFLTYNFFSDLRGPDGGTAQFRNTTVNTTINGNPAIVTTQLNNPAAINSHREVAGFEKSFLDGTFSLGMRVPLIEQTGDGTFTRFGDLSAIFKYALWKDTNTGSVISTGLAVTAPTGPDIQTIGGTFHCLLFQPFLGYRWCDTRLFVQGFSSVAVPTQSPIPTVLFNDIAVGYKLYQGGPLDSISHVSPVLEAHLTTPLNRRNSTNLIIAPDLLALVGGVQIGLFGPSTLTFGLATPVTGPKPYDLEAIVQLNYRY